MCVLHCIVQLCNCYTHTCSQVDCGSITRIHIKLRCWLFYRQFALHQQLHAPVRVGATTLHRSRWCCGVNAVPLLAVCLSLSLSLLVVVVVVLVFVVVHLVVDSCSASFAAYNESGINLCQRLRLVLLHLTGQVRIALIVLVLLVVT